MANAALFPSVLILSRKAKNFLGLFSELFVPNGPLFFVSLLNQILLLPAAAAAAAKSLQSCWTLCDPIDGSPPGSPVPGILQARTLECVAISISNA